MIRGPTKGPDPYNLFGGGGEHVEKTRLCDFCGMEFGGERCNICGRTMCDSCWSKSSPYQRCLECLCCPICRSGTADHPCTICGKIVCKECISAGVCIECASKRLATSAVAVEHGKVGSRVILEPVLPLSNAICEAIAKTAKQAVMGSSVRLGRIVNALGSQFKVVAVSPLTLGEVAVGERTVVSLVNRDERDARLRTIRKSSNWPICFVDGCDFAIGRKCVSCSRFVCPNHSSFCVDCKKILCFECAKEGLCKFCWNVKLGIRPRLSFRELARVLFRLHWLIPIWMIFIFVFYYGEFLESVNPSLRPLVSFGMIVAGPVLAILYPLIRTLRRRSGEVSEERKG